MMLDKSEIVCYSSGIISSLNKKKNNKEPKGGDKFGSKKSRKEYFLGEARPKST